MNQNEVPHKEIIRGLASALLLASLLIGLPILLVAGVGWPLPKGIPSGSDGLTAIKTGAIPSSLILKSISLVVWILWFQLLIGMGIEVWAHLRGRVAPRISFIPSFVQRLSTQLMGTILVIAFSIQHPGMAMAENQELLAPTTIETETEPSWGFEFKREDASAALEGVESEAPSTHGSEPGEPQSLIHTVERRDSLRSLAEQYLGDPNRWTEVFVLNQGQSQAVGGSLTDPARLQPGWELVMPADAHLPTSAEFKIDEPSDKSHQTASPLTALDDSMVTVQRGDTLWGLADQHLNDPERWVDIFNSNQEIIQDPNVVLPGWQLQLPAQELEPAAAELPTQPRPAPENPVSPVMAYTTSKPTVVASVPTVTESPSAPSRQAMLAVGGLGVFVSSLGWMLARLRKMQRRRMPKSRMPLPPSRKAVLLDEQLQAASDPDSALFLDASLRIMSARIIGNSQPDIIGVTLDSDSVSIHLNSPFEAPSGLLSSRDNTTWTMLKNASLEQFLAEADGVPAPLPALATVGKGNGKECLLNLEFIAALSLEGDSEAIIDLCAAMATQLASSHLADDLSVLCVGFGQDLTVFERVEYEPDVTSALERICQHRRQHQAMLGNESPIAESRIRCNDDYWHPMVVLVPTRLNEEEASGLLEAFGSSVCVVAHGLDGAHWVAQLDEHNLLLQPIGLRLETHGLSAAAVAAVAELASSAEDTEGVPLAAPSQPPLTQLNHHTHNTYVEDTLPVDIEVQVMGTVDVLGFAKPFSSRRALDLVAYLAFHPEGADRDQLKAQVWPPDNPPSDSTVANTLSRARKALGTNDANEMYLPRVSSEGIYRLRPEVGTDIGRFEALVSAARNDPSERGREQLRTALELVRGTPFTGGAGEMYRWADFGLRTQIDCMVDAAAHELAKRCIEAGDSNGARWAAMTSLRLVGVCEQCYRWRLMAAAENPTEVRQIMAELKALLKRESNQPESDDLLSADLLELYEQLMSSRSVFK